MDHHHQLDVRACIEITLGAIVGVAIVLGCIILCLRCLKSAKSRREVHSCALPVKKHGVQVCMCVSGSKQPLHPYSTVLSAFPFWGRSMDDSSTASVERILRFTYKELQKATQKFTMVIGRGAFGAVYKATLPNNSVAAVKVLATNSKQGEKEFQNEVMLLGRLHHKNLSNLVGYCAEGGHRLLAFEYMSNGSLAARLHDERHEPLSWAQRVSIAQDIARGLEYLHDGAVPPVIHRDIKSSNILLDSCMVARVADFGLSKEADPDMRASG
eukprot:c5501_g1_i1 orf=1-807(-)